MPSDPNIWIQIYEHTPPLLRWLLGVLTLGLWTAYHMMWRRQQERIAKIESHYATKSDMSAVQDHIGSVHKDVREIRNWLMGDKK